jgi:DNA-binding response OmpR family regulator
MNRKEAPKSATRILLVDDDADFVAQNRTILEKAGYAVSTAYNGDDGLAKARKERPALIVLDVMMTTQTEGFNVSRELRNLEETKKIPLLMISSVNDTVPWKFEPDETWLPVDAFLEKPVKPERLLEEVRKRAK